MPNLLKKSLIACAVLLALLLAVVGVVAASFNPNDYKQQVIDLVQTKKQRTLAIPGTIKLRFYPKLGADLGRISLSERNSAEPFAEMEHARVSLAFWPLLKKEFVVDKIVLEGAKARLVRSADGKMNIDDLLAKDEKSQEKIRFDIDSVSLTKSAVVFDDKMAKRKLELTEINLESGKIANAVPSKLKLSMQVTGDAPAMAGKIQLQSGFMLDMDQQLYSLQDLDAHWDGKLAEFSKLKMHTSGDVKLNLAKQELALKDLQSKVDASMKGQELALNLQVPRLDVNEKEVLGDKIQLSASMQQGKDKFSLDLQAPSFKGSRSQLSLPQISAQIAVLQQTMQAKGKLETELQVDLDKMLLSSKQLRLQMDGTQDQHTIQAQISSPLQVELGKGLLKLPQLALKMTLPHPVPKSGTLALAADGQLQLDWQRQNVTSQFKGRLDESNFDAQLGLQSFATPHYRANLVIDKINADRYRPRAAAVQQARAQESAANPAPEVPLDLKGLANLRADTSLQVGNIIFSNLQMNNLKLQMRAQPGKIEVAPLVADLYGGTVKGSIGLFIGKQQQFIVKQNLHGIMVGPLLKDALNKRPLEGKGDVALDIQTTGATLTQWKRGLSGNANMSLRDGSVSGFNLAQIVRSAKGAMGSQQDVKAGTSSGADKTDFSELSGSFQIANGVARNQDLSVKSPLFRVAGNGEINLADERLDYLVKPTIVSTLQGQGGPELQALKGLTIPVRLTGPFTAVAWKIDFASLAKEAAAQKVNEKKEEVKTRLQDKLKDSLKGLFGK